MAKTLQEKIYEKLSYTSQDYNSILTELVGLFTGNDPITSNWNNISEADPFFIMLSLMAAHKDILNYMIDYRTLEGFMSTARERGSLTRIANSFGYKIPSYRAARALVEFDALNTDEEGVSVSDNFTLESMTQFRDSNNVPWAYVGETKTITNMDQVELFQGMIMSATLSFDNVDRVSRTHILTSQSIAIGNTYNDDGVSTITDTLNFIEVPSVALYSDDAYRVYELNVDPQGITYIKFKDSIDLDEFAGESFTINYLITQGATTKSVAPVEAMVSKDGTDYLAGFSVIDNEFYLGANAYTAQEIKEGFRTYIASTSSLITVDDFKNYVLNQTFIPGITKCLVIDNQRCTAPYLTAPFTNAGTALPKGFISIYTSVGSYGDVNFNVSSFTGALSNHLRDLTSSSVYVNVNQGETSDSDAEGQSIYVKISGIDENSNIQTLITDYINDKNFGSRITVSEIMTMLSDSDYSNLLDDGYSVSLSLNNSTWETNYVQLDYYQYPAVETSYITFI